GLVGGAPVHVVDGVHVKVRVARDQGLENVGGQVVGANVGQRPLYLADGRPAGIHDEYRAHAVLPLHVCSCSPTIRHEAAAPDSLGPPAWRVVILPLTSAFPAWQPAVPRVVT